MLLRGGGNNPTTIFCQITASPINPYVTFGHMFPTNTYTVTMTKLCCLGLPHEVTNIPCVIETGLSDKYYPVYTAISDETMLSNIRNYATYAELTVTYT